jgi:hypothetical protein
MYCRYVVTMYDSDQEAQGGCREALLLTWIAFRVLGPVLLALTGVVLLLMMVLVLMAKHPALVLIPVAIAAAGLYALYRHERSHDRTIEDLEDRYRGDGDG